MQSMYAQNAAEQKMQAEKEKPYRWPQASQEKCAAEQAYGTLQGTSNAAAFGLGDSPQAGLGYQAIPTTLGAPLLDQLSRRRSISADEASRLNRAISILSAHPEFEDLLWLIRSGLV